MLIIKFNNISSTSYNPQVEQKRMKEILKLELKQKQGKKIVLHKKLWGRKTLEN